MRTAFYKRLSPSALAVADLCDYYGKGLVLTRINVPVAFRGQGHARELLAEILAEADTTKTRLWLEIGASDGLDADQLRAWYSRHGFRDIGGIFTRKPQESRP